MMSDVIRLVIGLREIAEQSGEGRTVIQLECHEGDPRAELIILREDVLCGRLECDLDHAFEMLACAHELFRMRGHGLRVEILARRSQPLS
jgi:hypothetical protein